MKTIDEVIDNILAIDPSRIDSRAVGKQQISEMIKKLDRQNKIEKIRAQINEVELCREIIDDVFEEVGKKYCDIRLFKRIEELEKDYSELMGKTS